MVKKVTTYKTSNGVFEEDPARAYAWELKVLIEKIANANSQHGNRHDMSFSDALYIMQNIGKVTDLVNEYINLQGWKPTADNTFQQFNWSDQYKHEKFTVCGAPEQLKTLETYIKYLEKSFIDSWKEVSELKRKLNEV